MSNGPLLELAEGAWVARAPVRILGMPLESTMTVLRVHDGLLVHSPIPLTPEAKGSVDSLGVVSHLYAPNTFHHRWIGDWSAVYPRARVHAPLGLRQKRPDLRLDRTDADADEPAFAGLLDEVSIKGFALEERALVYRPAGLLVVADLIHNIGRPPHWWTRMYAGAMGFYGRAGLSRMLRWAAFTDRARARESIDRLLAHRFEQVVVGHGDLLSVGGREAVVDAYGWLRPGGDGGHGEPDDERLSLRGAPCG